MYRTGDQVLRDCTRLEDLIVTELEFVAERME